MIIDFSYPTIVGNNWAVRVIEVSKQGDLFPKLMKFNTKSEAFTYYENVREEWQKNNLQSEKDGQTKIPFSPTIQLALQLTGRNR